jgi:hypothetical protein
MTNEVVVTNKNPKEFSDGYEGMKFTFKPNEKVSIPLAAAVHIFGFNKENKMDTLRRLGLANHVDGAQFLKNFDMKYVEYIKKNDAEDIVQLKIDLEAVKAERDELTGKLEAAETQIIQLTDQLADASKTTKK